MPFSHEPVDIRIQPVIRPPHSKQVELRQELVLSVERWCAGGERGADLVKGIITTRSSATPDMLS